MREFKFRSWYIEDGFMTEPWSFFQLKNNKCNTDELIYIGNCEKSHIIMQFTELEDINGREIFERDIIEYSMNAREIGMVVFYDGAFCVKFKKESLFDQQYFEEINSETASFMKILGNIYENPELME